MPSSWCRLGKFHHHFHREREKWLLTVSRVEKLRYAIDSMVVYMHVCVCVCVCVLIICVC